MAANTVLNYLPRKSVVHELTGTTKLAFFLLFTFAGMITYNTWVLFVPQARHDLFQPRGIGENLMQIREVFDRKRFVFLDGGMGTQLQARGLQPGQKPELAALEMPDVLTAIHTDYANAGADILLANIASMNDGKAAGVINGCWIMSSVQAAADQSGKWAIVNMPKLDGIDGATNYANCGGASWAVSSNCKNTELAFDFLKSTFGSSVELYDDLLPNAGAISSYLPAAESDSGRRKSTAGSARSTGRS